MGVDIETGSMTRPQRYILQTDDGVHNDGGHLCFGFDLCFWQWTHETIC